MKIALYRFCCFFLLLVILSPLIGQESSQNKFIPNFHIGFNTSQVDGDEYAGFNKIGLLAGLGIRTKFSEELGLGFDLTYIQKGSKRNPNAATGNFTFYTLALQYVEVPVYLTYYQNRFNFDAGFSAGYLLKSFEERHTGVIQPIDFYEFRQVDVSWLLGFDYKIKENVRFQIRYSYSLLPFRKSSDNPLALLPSGQYHNLIVFKTIFDLAQ